MEFINTELRLRPGHSKTNISLPFRILCDLTELEMEYSYSPKELTDCEKALKMIDSGMEQYATKAYRDQYPPSESYLPVVNLVTLSLDGPDGYRGCAHRHDPQQYHRISGEEASPGFLMGRPEKGDWNAVLNVHAVVTEECIVKLRIAGKEIETGNGVEL